ncbi:MAG: glycoside hydrolase family 97 protein [Prolixibacteraceae bacterium]|nr:glycoside hydrolase family 97 protein [Prolixibacteraceae bacterium]
MKKYLFLLIVLFISNVLVAKDYSVSSPDGKIKVVVTVDDQTTYAVSLNGSEIISPSPVSMTLSNGIVLGRDTKVKKAKTISIEEQIQPVVQRKYASIDDIYNQMSLPFKDYSLQFRAYNDGVAWRWVSEFDKPFNVISEEATFNFPTDHNIWFPEEESMYSHQEREYLRIKLSDVDETRFCSTGMLVDCGNNTKVYISESDLTDYPGMYLKGMDDNLFGLQGKFPGVVLEAEQRGDRDVRPTKYADFIAECFEPRTFPWRAMIITENDADLVQSEMIYKLAPECRIEDTGWIKPGKVAWDWWNALNIYGVDFESGVNNDTYKYYIDFASEYGLDYIILDEGWYHLDDIMYVVDAINIQELVDYGKEKNVGIILWVVWKALDDKLAEALDQFEKWEVKGIKIDFMQRDDQWMVNFYEKIARECASRHLLVDYHGAYKPSGLNRTYPNVLSFEGVKGMENEKWSNLPDPEHDLTLPFIRNVAGPMDYTPGAMLNATKQNFNAVFSEPMSQGTRCHQLAMYVVFESPLQMLADNPSNYYREPECMEFLSPVPSVWDDTKVLASKVSDYIAVARRSGNNWYLGAMTDWTPRSMEIKLDFLEPGNYTLQLWKDGTNATKHAADYKMETISVTNTSTIKIEMAPGGGWAGIIKKK